MDLMNILDTLTKTKSMYEIALDMGISEYSLYCYRKNFNTISKKRKELIENYLKRLTKSSVPDKIVLYKRLRKVNTSLKKEKVYGISKK